MVYENVRVATGFRADLVIEDKVIVEVKSVELLAPMWRALQRAANVSYENFSAALAGNRQAEVRHLLFGS